MAGWRVTSASSCHLAESRDFPAAESEGRTRPGGEGGDSAGGPSLPPSPGAVVRCGGVAACCGAVAGPPVHLPPDST
ncbi:uncharacterized protein LOC123516623 isoform X2 [Portunus trituberculatus]|uniref:uncharacterized protein LOC123516623 isoform X2 n=1 Tax=Portunus trituberculatus TaxID=210409 RepID=UPI001E1CE0DF|nr:uncharacterized protein LOC123516623 isoform X2 [Portunus trituberculatus]